MRRKKIVWIHNVCLSMWSGAKQTMGKNTHTHTHKPNSTQIVVIYTHKVYLNGCAFIVCVFQINSKNFIWTNLVFFRLHDMGLRVKWCLFMEFHFAPMTECWQISVLGCIFSSNFILKFHFMAGICRKQNRNAIFLSRIFSWAVCI